MEKKTLEEAAKRLQKDKYGIFISKDIDVKGQLVIDTAKAAFKSGMIEGAKWQAERMYSEEEVYNLLCSMPNFFNMTIPQQIKARNNWFEQFKKKKYERRNSNNTFIRN
jgi:hypothetical protein